MEYKLNLNYFFNKYECTYNITNKKTSINNFLVDH